MLKFNTNVFKVTLVIKKLLLTAIGFEPVPLELQNTGADHPPWWESMKPDYIE